MKIHHKLRSRRGETLTETLAAVLIVGLASVVLASMIGAASHIRSQALKQDEELYQEITSAESRTGSGSPGGVTVQIDGANQDFPVTYYGGDQLCSYAYRKGGGGA